MCTGSGTARADATLGLRPGRALGHEDALERHVRLLRRRADGVGLPCEEAEDDLVRAHEQRTEIAHRPSLLDERVGGSSCALVERAELRLPHPGPEALGHVLHAAPVHDRQARTVTWGGKEGKPSRYMSLRASPARERIPSLRYTRVRFASTVLTDRNARCAIS